MQDPREAEFPDMPESVLNKIKVDYKATLDTISGIIKQLNDKPLPEKIPVPQELQLEADITEKMMTDIDELKKIANHTDFTCPDCGGQLWSIRHDPTHRYRCYTGHVYSERLLAELQSKNIEESLWVSIRMLEEKQNLLVLAAGRELDRAEASVSSYHARKINDFEVHIRKMKSMLMLLAPHMRKSDDEFRDNYKD